MPIALEWLFHLGGRQVECSSDFSSISPGDVVVDKDGIWLIASFERGTAAFGLLACAGRRKGMPQEGILFKKWSIKVDNGRFVWGR